MQQARDSHPFGPYSYRDHSWFGPLTKTIIKVFKCDACKHRGTSKEHKVVKDGTLVVDGAHLKLDLTPADFSRVPEIESIRGVPIDITTNFKIKEAIVALRSAETAELFELDWQNFKAEYGCQTKPNDFVEYMEGILSELMAAKKFLVENVDNWTQPIGDDTLKVQPFADPKFYIINTEVNEKGGSPGTRLFRCFCPTSASNGANLKSELTRFRHSWKLPKTRASRMLPSQTSKISLRNAWRISDAV
ncbi:hypothetical protein V1525DRAFT_392045 [Lipomyces kononenkoae]|uniref:Uncharacterized protein n=1 Tax=Lipomyces kononenkoae TaxID=34357 RepID=A0ACC3SR54_LIPKO